MKTCTVRHMRCPADACTPRRAAARTRSSPSRSAGGPNAITATLQQDTTAMEVCAHTYARMDAYLQHPPPSQARTLHSSSGRQQTRRAYSRQRTQKNHHAELPTINSHRKTGPTTAAHKHRSGWRSSRRQWLRSARSGRHSCGFDRD